MNKTNGDDHYSQIIKNLEEEVKNKKSAFNDLIIEHESLNKKFKNIMEKNKMLESTIKNMEKEISDCRNQIYELQQSQNIESKPYIPPEISNERKSEKILSLLKKLDKEESEKNRLPSPKKQSDIRHQSPKAEPKRPVLLVNGSTIDMNKKIEPPKQPKKELTEEELAKLRRRRRG